MKLFNLLTIASLGIVSSCILTSCQDEDFGFSKEEITASVYARNFEKAFGQLSEIPTFDLSSYNLNKMGLEKETRADGDVYTVDNNWFYVPAGIEQWLTTNLPEAKKNIDKGTTNFSMSMPSNDILIIPVYQGQSCMTWDLYVTDGKIDNSGNVSNYNTNQKIWSKSQGIEVKKAGTGSTGINYTTKVVASQSFQHTGYTSYNNGADQIIQLYNYLQSMSFNASTQWFKIEVTSIDSKFNGADVGLQYIYDNNGSNDWKNFRDSNNQISNGSVTFVCQDEEFLRNVMKSTGDNQVKLSIWGGRTPNNANQVNNIKITIYEKTTTNSTDDNDWQNVATLSTNNENNRNTIGETIRAHAINLKQNAFSGGTFSMYLHITNIDSYYYGTQKIRGDWADRENQASTAGQMIALTELTTNSDYLATVLNVLKSTYGEDEYKFMFIGCEDANTGKADYDMNDIVFLIVGKELPQIHDKDDEIIKKRYMIEDLGSTFDFDFNDIVVDVTQVKKYTGDNVSSITTTAELKHLCGTIPFQIGFGSGSDIYWFPIMPGNNNGAGQGGEGYTPSGDSYSSMLNNTNNLHQSNKDYWDPNTNNIYVRVWPKAAGITPNGTNGSWTDEQKSDFLRILNSLTFTFPETGEYPYIIACDQTIDWMKELITIPTNWFSVNPKNKNPQYGGGGNTGGNTGGNDQGGNTTPNTNLNNGPVTIASKSDGNYNQAYYTFDDNTANSLQAGDVLVITADKNRFQLVFNNDWSNGHIYTPVDKGNNYYELTLTADQVSAIKANHTVTFNGGDNVTISQLTVRKGTSGGNETQLWSGSKVLGWSDNNGKLQLTGQSLSSGNKVRVYYTASNNGTIQVFQIVGSWQNQKDFSVNTGSGYVEYDITQNATGIAVQGDNSISITKITKL